MESVAKLNYARISPRKVKIVIDMIKIREYRKRLPYLGIHRRPRLRL